LKVWWHNKQMLQLGWKVSCRHI